VSPDPGEPPTVACSLVSGSLLHRVAEAHGVRSASTLTGFKWIARVPGLVMGYEEAIGYCVAPSVVRDKDGISTAALLVELAAACRARSESLLDRLDALALAHGVHLTAPVTLRLDDMSVVAPVLRRLLASPPADLAGTPVSAVQDLDDGVDGLPPTTGVRLLARGAAGRRPASWSDPRAPSPSSRPTWRWSSRRGGPGGREDRGGAAAGGAGEAGAGAAQLRPATAAVTSTSPPVEASESRTDRFHRTIGPS
jgi:hypothetical protein